MNEELEGCQYEICCNSDKYFKLQQQLKDKDEKISKVIEYCLIEREDINGSKCDDILKIIKG